MTAAAPLRAAAPPAPEPDTRIQPTAAPATSAVLTTVSSRLAGLAATLTRVLTEHDQADDAH